MENVFDKPLLGGKIRIGIIDVEESIAGLLIDKIYSEGRRLEKIFNFYDSKSELSKLNEKRKLKVSSQLLEVIKFGIKLSALTQGNYDISLGRKFKAQKEGKEIPSLSCSYKDIQINDEEVMLLNEDVLIDLGSIAKGYIVDCLIEYMKEKLGLKRGFIDARGDIGFFGNKEKEVLIEHPRVNGEFIHKLKIKNKAIATSGDYRQYHKNYDNSHIVGKNEFILVSVIDKSCMVADGLATSFMTSPENTREQILKKFKNSKFFSVDKDLKIKFYNGFR